MNWFTYALIGAVLFSGMVLLFKKITATVKPATLMLYVAIFLTIFYLLHVTITKTPIKINGSAMLWIAAASLLSYIANLVYTKSIALAPNAGYSTTIVSLQLVVITVASVFLFGAEINLIKGFGILLAIISIVVLSL
ncbi:MAG: EamA family transporter [archaeon]|nr:EamA family transporter [archaeon]